MVDVRDRYDDFRQAGGEVAAVTMGNPAQAAAFRERLKLPFVVLADAERAAYRAYGVQRGNVSQIAGPRVWLPGVKALVRGGAGKPTGDVMQMQGAFVVDRGGVIRFVHRGADSADNPSCDVLIGELKRLN